DLERILARIALASCRPRDLTRLKDSLAALPGIKAALSLSQHPLLLEIERNLPAFTELEALLSRAIVECPPAHIREGGVIADHYDVQLDELRALSQNSSDYLLKLEAQEKEKTGIATLKVNF